MKDKIEGIIDIDKRTQEIVADTENKIQSYRDKLKDTLTQMENESNEKAKKAAQEQFDAIISEAEKEAEKRAEANQEKLKSIDMLYEKNKDYLIETAFNKIILGRDE